MTALTSDRIRALEHIRLQPAEGASAAVKHAATRGNWLFVNLDEDGSRLAEFEAAGTAAERTGIIRGLLSRADEWERTELLDALDAVAAELAEVAA